MTDAIDDKINDVALCYSAMGLSIDDPPAKVEMTYKRLREAYKAGLSSGSPQAREEANENLKLLDELYNKIINSVTYKTVASDQARRESVQGGPNRGRSGGSAERAGKVSLISCPKCNTVVNKGTKVCPRCKTRIYTDFEKAMKVLTSKTSIVIMAILVVMVVLAVLGFIFFDQIMEIVNSYRQ